MTLVLNTAATSEPLTVAEVKLWLRIDGDDQNDVIQALIRKARIVAETTLRRQLFTATWKLLLDDFPHGCDFIRLPLPPLASITSVQYVDTAGDTQTWSSDEYSADTDSEPGRLLLGYGEVYPTTRSQRHAVTITYVAGWTTVAAIPESVKSDMGVLIGRLYYNRELIADGGTPQVMGELTKGLFSTDRVMEFV